MLQLRFLIVLAIGATSFAASFHSNLNSNNEAARFRLIPPRVSTYKDHVTLEQFSAYEQLGYGHTSKGFLVKKNGGSDDGKLYALKATKVPVIPPIKITSATSLDSLSAFIDRLRFVGRTIFDSFNWRFRGILPEFISSRYKRFNSERKILETIKDIPFCNGVHYAFAEGQWLFLILDLIPGGYIDDRLKTVSPDSKIMQSILAEMVVAVEKIHSVNVLHHDLTYFNFLVDSDGHLVLIDFGTSTYIHDENDSNLDWKKLAHNCMNSFSISNRSEVQTDLIKKLENLTDSKIPELKNHPYFHGVDWEKVAARESEPPFEPTEYQFNFENPIDLVAELNMRKGDELEPTIAEYFRNFSYIAPEHQN